MDLSSLTQAEWLDLGISLAIIFLAAILARPILSIILDRGVKRITGATQTTLDDQIIEAVRPPLYWLILIFVFQFAVDRSDFITSKLSFDFEELFGGFYILLAFAISWRLVNYITEWYSKEVAPKTESNLDDQLIFFIRRIGLILIAAIAIITILGHFNIEVGGLVATLGIGSLAIALAAQAALSDTISGFLIMLDRPFRIGDRIEIQDLGTWGDVTDIGLRSTRIRTRDNRMVIVPNSTIAKSLIVNHSFPDSQYRIQIEIGVAYSSDIEKTRQVIIEAVSKVEGVLPDKPVEALFLEFGNSSLIFRVRWWLESYVDTRRMFDRVNTAMHGALGRAGIELPFPQRDVHHKINPNDMDNIIKVFQKK